MRYLLVLLLIFGCDNYNQDAHVDVTYTSGKKESIKIVIEHRTGVTTEYPRLSQGCLSYRGRDIRCGVQQIETWYGGLKKQE